MSYKSLAGITFKHVYPLFCYSHGIPQTLPGNCFIKIYRHLILLVYTSAIFPFEHSISVPTPPLLSNLSHLAVTVTSFFSSRCFKNLAVYYLESNRCADGGITCLNIHEIHFLMTASKFFFILCLNTLIGSHIALSLLTYCIYMFQFLGPNYEYNFIIYERPLGIVSYDEKVALTDINHNGTI